MTSVTMVLFPTMDMLHAFHIAVAVVDHVCAMVEIVLATHNFFIAVTSVIMGMLKMDMLHATIFVGVVVEHANVMVITVLAVPVTPLPPVTLVDPVTPIILVSPVAPVTPPAETIHFT